MSAGTLRQRKPGHWEGRIDIAPDPITKKRRQISRSFRAKTKREAERQFHAFQAEVYAGQRQATTQGTLDHLLERWMALKGPTWSPTTLARAEQCVRIHISPALGKLTLARLTAWRIDEFYSSLRTKGLGPATVRKVHGVLHAALRQAVRWQWMNANPADTDVASPPKVPKAQVKVPTVEQVQRLMAAAEAVNPDIACMARLAATTGARRGELCGIRWRDFEFNYTGGDDEADSRGARTGRGGRGRTAVGSGQTEAAPPLTASLRIVRAVVAVKGKVTVQNTKTAQSERRIELDPATVADVLAQMERVRARAADAQIALVDDPYLFSSIRVNEGMGRRWSLRLDGGAPWNPGHATAVWRQVRESVGLPDVQMRTLRHWVSTQLLGVNVDIKTVQRRLGHSRAATTLDTYGTWIPGKDGAAATHMADLLQRKAPAPKP